MDFTKPWRDSDQVLYVEEKSLHVHRTILSLWSPVFDRMFNSNFLEKEAKEIKLHNKKYTEITSMLEIIYDRRKTVTESNVGFLLSLSDEYQMDQLYCECVKFIKSDKGEDLKYLHLIIQYDIKEIKDKCLAKMERTFSNNIESKEEYKELNDTIKYMIANKRVKYLEKQIAEYGLLTTSILTYMYINANKSFEDFLRELGLEESIFSRCELSDKHEAIRTGNKFDIKCSLCRKRICAAKNFQVNTRTITDLLESLYQLNMHNEIKIN